jgi:catechol 2,3-dioxygenase-like lactoylglutathione lyase family enzyme
VEAVTDFRAKLVPEFTVSDIERSLRFWCECLGFEVIYDRPEEKFAYLDLNGAQVMLEQRSDLVRQWVTGEIEYPLGRGINFQIVVDDVALAYANLIKTNWPIYLDMEEKWYRAGDTEVGAQQFLVQDPDGYLLRLTSSIGQRNVQQTGTEN